LFGEEEAEREVEKSVDEIIAKIEAEVERCEEILDEVYERSSTPPLRIVTRRIFMKRECNKRRRRE